MDRRQQKTREAIFQAFTKLIVKKPYYKITIQEIIDKANIGRSTFYAHFETKDKLIQTLCHELFKHILQSLSDKQNTHCLALKDDKSGSIFFHILQHLKEDDNPILRLLSCENNEIFVKYFKDDMNNLLCNQAFNKNHLPATEVPENFLINHISASFIEMVQWWIGNKMQPEPAIMDKYFREVMSGAFQKIKEFDHNHIWIEISNK